METLLNRFFQLFVIGLILVMCLNFDMIAFYVICMLLAGLAILGLILKMYLYPNMTGFYTFCGFLIGLAIFLIIHFIEERRERLNTEANLKG